MVVLERIFCSCCRVFLACGVNGLCRVCALLCGGLKHGGRCKTVEVSL